MRSSMLPASIFLLCCSLLRAAQPIPPDKRIPATIPATISAPTDQPMHMPTDVAVDSKGRIFVADGANDRVLQFAPDGKLEQAITDPGNQKLNRPVGITIDSADQLWIADTGNHRLIVLAPDGLQATPITPLQIDNAYPPNPTDLAVTPDRKRTYVVDNTHHRILVRDNHTRQWSSLGAPGQAIGQFQYPFMISIGLDNDVYVSETIGTRVQRISASDRWAGQIGQFGVELGRFYRPKGLATDSAGRLFVADSTIGVIQVFTSRGAVQGVLTDPAGQPLRFQHPMGICFDKQGKLYVVELKANRVAIVSLQPDKK